MKKIYISLIFSFFLFPIITTAETYTLKVQNALAERNDNTAVLSWENPKNISFSKTILFRSEIPIADYFTYDAVAGLCDKIYEGQEEIYTDTSLAINLPYYYILFTQDKSNNYSNALVLQVSAAQIVDDYLTENTEETIKEENEPKEQQSLIGAPSNTVNEVTMNEAGIVYNYNGALDIEPGSESNRLALFIIVKSPHNLSGQEKRAISYFIHAGTPTTIFLGTGERAGVLNSYLSAFNKLPRNESEWQDIVKIANGRWPEEKSLASEEKASNLHFQTIYQRSPDMNNPKDNAAVTIISYGLRPANRNLESEKNAIKIYRAIFEKDPVDATDWDLVRAIAYSGAVR